MILPLVFRLKPWQAVPRPDLLFGYRLDVGGNDRFETDALSTFFSFGQRPARSLIARPSGVTPSDRLGLAAASFRCGLCSFQPDRSDGVVARMPVARWWRHLLRQRKIAVSHRRLSLFG